MIVAELWGLAVGDTAAGEWLLRADQSIRANRLLTRAARGGDGPRLSETRLWEPRLWGSGCCERINRFEPTACSRGGSGRGRAEAVGDAIVGTPAVGEWLLRADQSIRANRLLTRAAQGVDGPRLSETRLWEPRLWGSGCCERINRFEPTACSRARLRAWTGRFPTFLRESDMNLPAGGSKRERRFVDERGIFVSKGS